MTLWLALASGKDFGWGICGEAIRRNVGKLRTVKLVDRNSYTKETKVDGVVLHTLKDSALNREVPIWGDVNFGYTFTEFTLNEEAIENAKRLDGIFAGSTWCAENIKSYGIENVHVLVQGVDGTLFNADPGPPRKDNGFKLFSGGKLEYRKGQDIVIEAFRRLQKKHRHLEMVTAWWNPWPHTLDTLQLSPHIDYVPFREGQTWPGYAYGLCAVNVLFPNRLLHADRIPHEQIHVYMKSTDMGLFLSRAEGGTNLVMMEYMACGKPAIVSNFTGHLDVITPQNCLPVESERGLTLVMGAQAETTEDLDAEPACNWFEPDIKQVCDHIEWGIEHKHDPEWRRICKQASEDMKQWTWERTAKTIVEKMGL